MIQWNRRSSYFDLKIFKTIIIYPMMLVAVFGPERRRLDERFFFVFIFVFLFKDSMRGDLDAHDSRFERPSGQLTKGFFATFGVP